MPYVDNLLTTDELLTEMEVAKQIDPAVREKRQRKIKLKVYILWGIVILAVLHLFYLVLPLMIGTRNMVNIFGETQVIGVPYEQEDPLNRIGHVIVIEKYYIDDISIGDRVIVYGLVDTPYHWEVEIQSVNQADQLFTAAFNDINLYTFSFDEIEGVYARDAGLIGTIFLVSNRLSGFLGTTAVYASIIMLYYIFAVREMKIVKEEHKHEPKPKK